VAIATGAWGGRAMDPGPGRASVRIGRLLSVVAAVGLVVMSAAGCGRSGEPRKLAFGNELQQILDDGVRGSNGLGVSAAVIAEGYEPWIGTAGHSIRSSEGLVEMRPEMLFEIGSAAKNLVTVVMLQLVEEGRVNLDDRVSRWFPGYSQIPPTATLRDLLASTSGIAEWVDHPDSLFQPPFDPQKLARPWTVDQMLTDLVGPPEFTPGEQWRYSTTGFRLAREIAEIETGQSIAQLIQARLLDPLGITDMWLEPSWPIPARYPVAHEWLDINGDQNLDDITAYPKPAFNDLKSAPVYANALDLARYCQGLFHDGALLGEEQLAAMLDFRTADDPAEPMAASYGLGTGTFNIPGGSGIEHYGHGGNGLGYVVVMLYLPQHAASVVIMTNDRGATMNTMGGAFLEAVDRGLGDHAPPVFVLFGFLVQVLLVADFAARRWRPTLERRYGWVIYTLGIPAAGLALYLWLDGAAWYQPLAFGLFGLWALFGAWVDYLRPVAWRTPPRWPVFLPYVGLFVTSLFAFWIPLWYVGLPVWLAFGALYAVHTGLNIASHVRHRAIR
jgi:D-alanyl-D-alanine carboxypeptidase